MNCDVFIWKNWYFPKNPNSPLTVSSDTNHVIRDEEHWKCCAMRRRCNRCVYHVSQHFAKRPPAVRCGSRWKWSLAGDLNWLNESLNDSWPQKERSLQLRTRLRVRSSWMGGAGEEEKEKRKRQTQVWRRSERTEGEEEESLRLCNSKKQESCWSAVALHTWPSLMLWCITHTHTQRQLHQSKHLRFIRWGWYVKLCSNTTKCVWSNKKSGPKISLLNFSISTLSQRTTAAEQYSWQTCVCLQCMYDRWLDKLCMQALQIFYRPN